MNINWNIGVIPRVSPFKHNHFSLNADSQVILIAVIITVPIFDDTRDTTIVRQQSVLHQKVFHVIGVEIFTELVRHSDKVAHQLSCFVDKQCRHTTDPKALAQTGHPAAYFAELDLGVLLTEAHQAAVHCLAAVNVVLVHVDYHCHGFVYVFDFRQQLYTIMNSNHLKKNNFWFYKYFNYQT